MKATSTQELALKIIEQYVAQWELYLADCEADRKREHRPHFCEHGMNLHVDHDPICGSCEEGYSIGDPFYRRQLALSEAKSRIARADRISVLMFDLDRLMPDLDVSPIIAEICRLYGKGK
jgi:hypothetical protein